MEFRILGPLEVVDEGRSLRLGSGRQLALVAVLLLHANEAVSVDRLVDELWGDSPPPTAAKIVRNYVSLLRRELGDRLVTQPPGYLLRVEDGELDSVELEQAVGSGDAERTRGALLLWRGPPLAQFEYEPFAQSEIARLEELRLAAIERRVDEDLALGRHADVLPELESLVQRHPLRERLRAQLMLALYRSGRQADALEAYRAGRRALDELGIEPGADLRELERKILNQDESLGAPPAPEPDRSRARRRRSAVLAGAAAALAVVSTAGFLLTRNSAEGLSGVPANHVGVIDPETDAVVSAIPVGIRPGPMSSGDGSVWVGNLDDRNVTRIDARRRVPVKTVSLGDRTPTGLAFSPRSLWVAHGPRGELSRVEPQFGRLAKTVAVTSRQAASADGSVAVDDDRLWAAYADSTLARIDRGTMRVSGSVITGAIPAGVVAAAGAIWVVNSADATVQRFDPFTFEEGPVDSISVGTRPSSISFGEGALWVTNRGDDSVTRISPDTGATFDIPVGDEPVAAAAGAGGVWVANSGDGTVSRIDPGDNEVIRTFRLGGTPAGVALADAVVWVAVQSE
jgi:YVTN family beta-propeller protein